MPKGVYVRKNQKNIKQHLERIQEDYAKRHGITGPSADRTLSDQRIGNGVEVTTEYTQGTERYTGKLVSGYAPVDAGISDGQATDRELYRGDRRTGESDEPTDRGNDSFVSPYEPGVGSKSATATPVKKKTTNKKAPSVTPDKPEPVKAAPKLITQPMSEREANSARQHLYEAFVGAFSFFDDSLQMIVNGHEKVEIWSTIDDPDIMVMVDRALRNAQKSVFVAQNIRRVIWMWDQVQIGAILMPRFIQSFQLLATKGFSIPGMKKGGFNGRTITRTQIVSQR